MIKTWTTALILALGISITGAAQQATTPDVVLPKPLAPFTGHIDRTAAASKPAWPVPVTAPANAPNVLLILTDDVGFAASSTFGGPVPTPNLDRLAQNGLKYNAFHTTAICSPTRAALLTGRNHHAVATGTIVDAATGYPGYWSIIPKSAATIAEILKDNGYNTAMFGKHHNAPNWQASAAGPFDLWPTGLGFEYFYGFMGGDSTQWNPHLYRGISPVTDAPINAEQPLDHALADEAIHWVHNQKANAPDKPFFLYYAPGSTHAPQQAPADWIAKFKGRFDQGWDKQRDESFARQKAMGIVPSDTALTPRPAELPAWDSLSPTEKKVDARFMEVYAAMLAYQDAQIGRILDELKRMGQLDNTLVFFIEGDNGASGEGTLKGTIDEIGMLANKVEIDPEDLSHHLDAMGGPHTYELYPAGWAWAMDTPFQWMKQIASHFGGMRNGMVVSWPNRIKHIGEMRSQFGHVVDIMPTILEATGIQAPTIVNGAPQQRIDGISLMYSFDQANAPEQHKTQYFEQLGNRAIYQDGWIASTTPRRMPWSHVTPPGNPDTDYKWELYDLSHDFGQAHDLAAVQPAKLKQLQDLWWAEAERNNVLPLDDSFGLPRSMADRIAHMSRKSDFTYWGKNISVGEQVGPSFAGRSFSITATITIPATHTTGVLAAAGSWFGGWSFYLKEGKPVAYESFSPAKADQYRVAATTALPPGPATIRYDFDSDGGGIGKGGLMRISVNGKEVARGRIERTITVTAGLGETFDVGIDTGAPVTDEYPAQGAFAGDIQKLEIHLAAFGAAAAVDAAKAKAASGSE